MEKNKSYELGRRSKWMLGIAFFVIIFSLFTPFLFTQFSFIDFTETGQIGDTIGGIMNPFIAIGGVLLTYLAFYMQFKANKLQREQFEIQIKEDKNQFRKELEEQQEQFKRNQFENQFYEMVRLHKENVNDIFVTIIKIFGNKIRNEFQLFGRKNFEYFIDEVEIAYEVAKYVFVNENKYFHINKAYSVVFHGIKHREELIATKPEQEEYCKYINTLLKIKLGHRSNGYSKLKRGGIKAFTNDLKLDIIPKNELYYDIFDGYSSFLGHYYRQLFQTVKFVVNQEFLNYEEKRKYLRILRAQLTNYEQVMLYYNWLAKFGEKWENEDNKFFTDYRMIHNVYSDLIIQDFSLIQEFDLINRNDYKKEKNRIDDRLFEFEDWN